MQDSSEIDTREMLAGQNGDLAHARAPEIVDALNAREPAEAAKLLRSLPAEKAIEVLDLPGLDNTCEILAELPQERERDAQHTGGLGLRRQVRVPWVVALLPVQLVLMKVLGGGGGRHNLQRLRHPPAFGIFALAHVDSNHV